MYNNPESLNARKRVAFYLNFLKIPQTERHLPVCRKKCHRNPARQIVTDVPWFHCEVWVSHILHALPGIQIPSENKKV